MTPATRLVAMVLACGVHAWAETPDNSPAELEDATVLVESKRRELVAVVPGFVFGKDRGFLYVLDATHSRLLKVEAQTLATAAESDLEGVPVAITCPSDCPVVYVAVRIKASGGSSPGRGRLDAFDPGTMARLSSIEFPGGPFEACADDHGHVIVSTDVSRDSILRITPAKSAVDTLLDTPQNARVRSDRAGRRFWFAREGFASVELGCMTFVKDPRSPRGAFTTQRYADGVRSPSGGTFEIAPGEDCLFSCRGPVLEVSAKLAGDLKKSGETKTWTCAAMATGCDFVCLAEATGFVNLYKREPLTLHRSLRAPGVPTRMLLDPDRRRLYVHFIPRPARPGDPETSAGGRNEHAGDLAAWDFAVHLPDGDAKPPPDPRPEDPPATDSARIELGDHLLGRPVLVDAGRQLLVLCAATHRLLGIDTGSFRTSWELPLDPPAHVLSVAPGGKIAFLASGKTITLVDLDRRKVTLVFDLDRVTMDLQALDDDRVVGSNESSAWVFSATTQSVVAEFRNVSGFMESAPDDSRIFTGNAVFDRPAIGAQFRLGMPPGFSETSQDLAPAARFYVTSGGRFLLEPSGRLSRLGRSRLALRAPVEKLPPWTAAVDLPAANQLILFRNGGKIDFWDLDTLACLKTVALEGTVSAAVADERKGFFYVHSSSSPGDFRIPRTSIRVTAGKGDLLRIPIPK